MQSNGTGPVSRQLQDKVGGVTPAGLLLIERRAAAPVISVHCTVGCREYAMKNIADLLMRVWQSSQPALLWSKTGIDPAWLILSASCRPTIKTSTAGIRGDRVST